MQCGQKRSDLAAVPLEMIITADQFLRAAAHRQAHAGFGFELPQNPNPIVHGARRDKATDAFLLHVEIEQAGAGHDHGPIHGQRFQQIGVARSVRRNVEPRNADCLGLGVVVENEFGVREALVGARVPGAFDKTNIGRDRCIADERAGGEDDERGIDPGGRGKQGLVVPVRSSTG